MRAMLLIGPTGVGKTPLGEHLERHGLWGRRCAHFDFGARLRAVAAGEQRVEQLAPEELETIERSLRTGAVLEDHQFPIAGKILRAFIERHDLGKRDWIVLNGLPRHVGQAKALESLVSVQLVLSLECPAEVVYERIRRNSGGDRTGRVDDDAAAIARKLEVFVRRTRPLIEYYAQRVVDVCAYPVEVNTTPDQIARWLEAHP